MNTLQSLLNSTLAYRLGITLLHSLWQGAAVFALLSIALVAMRKASSQSRYAVATVAMLLLVVLPAAMFFATTTPPAASLNLTAATNVAAPAVIQGVASSDFLPLPESIPHSAAASSAAHAAISFHDRYIICLPYIVAAWLLGVVILAVWNFGAWLAVQQLRRSAVQEIGADTDRVASTLCTRLGINRTVRVLSSTLARTPMVIGLLKPVILLPASALSELSMSELESIIAHELAHIRRHDYLINLLQAAVETVLFYHPAVWLISSRMRQEREHCCDDLALSVTRDRASYVRALAAVASIRVTSLVPAASSGKLLPRLQRLLGITDASNSRPSRWTTGVVVLTLIIAGGLFTHLHAADKTDDTTDPDLVWIHGHVFDPTGKPVAGAKIQTTGYSFKDPISDAISDVDGSYKISYKKSLFTNVQFGGDKTLVVAATAPHFGPGWAEPNKRKTSGDVDLKLAVDDVPVEGRIISLEGAPVAGVTIRGWSIHEKMTDLSKLGINGNDPDARADDLHDLDAVVLGPSRYTKTDADGRFKLTGFGHDRTVDIMLSGPTIADGFVRLNTRPGPKQTRTFQMFMQMTQTVYGSNFEYISTPGRIVRGTVRDGKTHEPLAGVRVSNNKVGQDFVTDAGGNYQINGYTQAAQYITLTAKPNESQPYIASDSDAKTPAGAEPVVIDFNLQRGVFITGQISSTVATKSLVPMEVMYLPQATNAAARTNREYTQLNIPGRYERFNSKSDGTFQIVGLPGKGVVVVRDNGTGDQFCRGTGAEFLKCPMTKEGRMMVFGPFSSPTDWVAMADVDIADGQPSARVNLLCDPGAKLHAKIVDSAGKPVIGANHLPGDTIDLVAIGPKEQRPVKLYHADRKLGKFVKVSAADAKNPDFKIQLEPVSTVKGRLIGRDGQPMAHALIEAAPVDIIQSSTDDDGHFSLTLIAGRPCNFWGVKGNNQFLTEVKDLVIPPGETRDLGDVHVK